MKSSAAESRRYSIVAACLFGLSLHTGCGQGDSGEPAPGTASPRMEKIQDAKARADAARTAAKQK